MSNNRTYKVGHEYKDDIANSKEHDQFVKWLPGIGNSKGIRPAKFETLKNNLPAFIVLITNEINHRHHNPWDDIVDYGASKIYYWGDAKFHLHKGYKEFDGNKTLIGVYENYLDRSYTKIPPILHFSKKKKGSLVFNGLCVITDVEITWFEDDQRPVKNYRFELSILDEEEISISWLISRTKALSIKDLNNQVPEAWEAFLKGRVEKLNIYKSEIRSKENQLPEKKSNEEALLEFLIKLKPVEFEAVLVKLFKMLSFVNHNITGTRLVKDGGFDFFGEFCIPFPLGYKIAFLGEAKKYHLNNAVGPGSVSRLVARLGRGQYGIFVTTSYYTTQAQNEVLEDGYPVKLYSGIDVVNFLRELKLIDKGIIRKDWIEDVIKSTKK